MRTALLLAALTMLPLPSGVAQNAPPSCPSRPTKPGTVIMDLRTTSSLLRGLS
jgi:hypothetical protein